MSLLKKKLTQKEGFPRDEFSGKAITVEPFRYKYTTQEIIDKQHQKDEINKIDLLSGSSKSQLSGVSIILLLIFLGFAVIGRKKNK